MNSLKFWVIAVVVVAVAAGGIAAVTLHNFGKREEDAREKEAEKPRVIQVKYVHPRKGALERLCVQPGSVQSFKSIKLFARVPGFLKYLDVDIGDHVKEGDLLALIDVPDIEAQLDRNLAFVEKAKSQLDQMKSRVDVAVANQQAAEAEVDFAKAMARSASAWVAYRKIQLGRMFDLMKSGSIEERVYDESKERYEASFESEIAANVKIATTKAQVVASKAKVKQAQADVKEAEAEVQLAEAEFKKTKVDLDFASITAPFDGVITKRNVNAGDDNNTGDFVRAANSGPNIEPLLTIDRTDLFRVVVLVPDRDVDPIIKGMPAMMKIDSLPKRTYYPKVDRKADKLDPNTRLMRVEFDLKNDKDGKICDGMYGQVTIVLDDGADQLSIPTSCIIGKIEDGKGSVYVIRAGKARKIDLKLGMDSGLRVAVDQVLKGETLTENDQIIIEPGSELARPAELTATEWDDSSTITLTRTKK